MAATRIWQGSNVLTTCNDSVHPTIGAFGGRPCSFGVGCSVRPVRGLGPVARSRSSRHLDGRFYRGAIRTQTLAARFKTWATDKPVIGTFLSVQTRMKEVRADALVNSIALRAFLAFIPLTLVGIAVLGFVTRGDQHLQARIVERLKITGSMVQESIDAAGKSRKSASVIGVITLLWSGLAVVSAIADACNAFWQVRSRGPRDRFLGIAWLVGSVVILTVASAAVGIVHIVTIPFVGLGAGLAVGMAAGTAFFWFTQRIMTNVQVPAGALLPGSLVGGATFAVLQLAGAYLIPAITGSASALYKSVAVVIATFTVLLLLARLLVMSVAINVIRWEKIHGTVALNIRAPALPGRAWVVTDRGGQHS